MSGIDSGASVVTELVIFILALLPFHNKVFNQGDSGSNQISAAARYIQNESGASCRLQCSPSSSIMISSIAFSCSFFPLVHIRQIQYPCHTATTLSTIPTRPSTRLTMRSILSSGREEMCADRGPIENSNIFNFADHAGSQSGERHWLKRRKVGFARATDLDGNTADTYFNRLLGSCSSTNVHSERNESWDCSTDFEDPIEDDKQHLAANTGPRRKTRNKPRGRIGTSWRITFTDLL